MSEHSDPKRQADLPDDDVVVVSPAAPTGAASEGPPRLSARQLYEILKEETPDMRVGQVLRRVRDHAGLSLEAVAGELRFTAADLMSIERMETGKFPPGYLSIRVRTYARRLGLDADRVVTDYTDDCGAVETVNGPVAIKAIDGSTKASLRSPVLAMGALAATIVMSGLAIYLSGERDEAPAPTRIQAGEPLNGAHDSLFADMPLPERIQAESLELMLVAVADGWVEVRGADATLYRSRVMRAGETYAPRIGAGWTINARDGAAFEWRVGDYVLGPLGPEATAVYAVSVDNVAARAAEAAAPAMAAAGNGQPSR